MKRISIFIILIIVVSTVIGVGYFLSKEKITSVTTKTPPSETINTAKLVDFSQINSEFLFSAKIPKELEVEYIPQLKAINIYNPSLTSQTNIEKSQLYISFFKANRFLTLNTVDITKQDKITIKEREAILYEITKKEGISNFYGQPMWRNAKHEALDIRLTKTNPSYFYSFAQNPNLSQKTFDDVINSLIFIDN